MLTGPAPASKKALAKAGITVDDLDLVEINEAFAAVVLRFVKDMGLDMEKVNVNGGAIAMGHPLGATGGMILGTLIDELRPHGRPLRPRHAVRRRRHGHRDRRGGHLMAADTIRWEDAGDGVVNLVLDDPNQSANTMNADFGASMKKTVERLEAEKDSISGVVLTSAKKTFFAGGDLNDLKKVTPETADEFSGWVRENKALLRRLETLGKPVVAAINGAALGGGLEIALACHRRIVVDDPKIQLGQPEVQLGLLPGAGGVVRITRMLGIVNGLMQVLLQGQRIRPAQAKEIGLVDELVGSPDELVPAAKKWIAENPEAQSSPGTSRATRSRAARRRTRSSRRTCRPSRPTCASRSRARTTRRRTTSWPRSSRARRSTSTPRWRSRAATSWTSPRARSPRT